MTASLAVRLGYHLIALGLRLPRMKRLEHISQQCRTIDEIKRMGIDVVLDVGANKGFYAKHLRMLGYSGRILSFEPDPDTFTQLLEMKEGDATWSAYNCALGEIEGEIDFNVVRTGDETVLSSALKPLGNLNMTCKRVPVRTVAEVLRSEGISPEARVFLKMDTQGYDLKVFEGTLGGHPIALLQSEVSVVPLYEGMPHYTDSLQRFEQAGFELLDLFVVNRTETGAVLEYDALMARLS